MTIFKILLILTKLQLILLSKTLHLVDNYAALKKLKMTYSHILEI